MTTESFSERFSHRLEPELNTGCLLWSGSASSAGYGTLNWKGKTLLAHRCAYDEYHGEGASDGIIVRHKCDTPPCVSKNHLIGGTYADNTNDAKERGRFRHAVGERASKSKLVTAEVIYIRAQAAAGVSVAKLAREFDLAHGSIKAIVNRRTWRHLPA